MSLTAAVLRSLLWVATIFKTKTVYRQYTVDKLGPPREYNYCSKYRRRDSSALSTIVLLTIVAWHRKWSSIVCSLHNHVNIAGRPHRTMQTYPRASNTKRSHKLPDIRNVFWIVFFLPHKALRTRGVFIINFRITGKQVFDHFFSVP